jgi:hypothetical protein
MGVAYHATLRFAGCHPGIPQILAERVLADGHKLVSFDGVTQVFKRGIAASAAWLLQGGGWANSPTSLTAAYIWLPCKTEVSLRWELSVPPLPKTPEEKRGWESWVRLQHNLLQSHLDQWATAATAETRHAMTADGVAKVLYNIVAAAEEDTLQRYGAQVAESGLASLEFTVEVILLRCFAVSYALLTIFGPGPRSRRLIETFASYLYQNVPPAVGQLLKQRVDQYSAVVDRGGSDGSAEVGGLFAQCVFRGFYASSQQWTSVASVGAMEFAGIVRSVCEAINPDRISW